MCLLPRMHQTSNNRYSPNGYASLRVTSIACGLKASKRHGKNTAFLCTCILVILPSVIINNKDLLKSRLIFNFYAHLSCKNERNNFLLLNTNAPLTSLIELSQQIGLQCPYRNAMPLSQRTRISVAT